jgi:hypothetical protein
MPVYGPSSQLSCVRIYAWKLASRIPSVVFPSPSRQTPGVYLVDHKTVTCIPIAKQRLGKHIPAEANARNSRTSISRQRISKHVSLTTETVFCAWCVQSGYKKVSVERYCCRELGRVLEMAVENYWQEMERNKLGCVKKTSYVNLQWGGYKYVTRIRLVKTENPSVCVCVCVCLCVYVCNCKLCKSTIALHYL